METYFWIMLFLLLTCSPLRNSSGEPVDLTLLSTVSTLTLVSEEEYNFTTISPPAFDGVNVTENESENISQVQDNRNAIIIDYGFEKVNKIKRLTNLLHEINTTQTSSEGSMSSFSSLAYSEILELSVDITHERSMFNFSSETINSSINSTSEGANVNKTLTSLLTEGADILTKAFEWLENKTQPTHFEKSLRELEEDLSELPSRLAANRTQILAELYKAQDRIIIRRLLLEEAAKRQKKYCEQLLKIYESKEPSLKILKYTGKKFIKFTKFIKGILEDALAKTEALNDALSNTKAYVKDMRAKLKELEGYLKYYMKNQETIDAAKKSIRENEDKIFAKNTEKTEVEMNIEKQNNDKMRHKADKSKYERKQASLREEINEIERNFNEHKAGDETKLILSCVLTLGIGCAPAFAIVDSITENKKKEAEIKTGNLESTIQDYNSKIGHKLELLQNINTRNHEYRLKLLEISESQRNLTRNKEILDDEIKSLNDVQEALRDEISQQETINIRLYNSIERQKEMIMKIIPAYGSSSVVLSQIDEIKEYLMFEISLITTWKYNCEEAILYNEDIEPEDLEFGMEEIKGSLLALKDSCDKYLQNRLPVIFNWANDIPPNSK